MLSNRDRAAMLARIGPPLVVTMTEMTGLGSRSLGILGGPRSP